MRTHRWAVGLLVVLGMLGLFGRKAELVGAAEEPAPAESASPSEESESTLPAQPKASQPAVSPEELDKLVQQLDADSFSDRQAASQRLAELGQAAIEALIRAATSESLEANVRALDILKKHLETGDAELKKAAKEALEKIAEGPRPTSARRAKDLLKAYEDRQKVEQLQPQGVQVVAKQVLPNKPGLQPLPQGQMIAPAAPPLRVTIRNNVKTMEGEEKDLKFRIVEDPKEGITVELTRTKEGKEVTEKFQAKTAEELQKNHPEAYEVYKRHAGGGVMLQPGGKVPLAPIQQGAPGAPQQGSPVKIVSHTIELWIKAVVGNAIERLLTEEALKNSPKQDLEELISKCQEGRQFLEKLEKRVQEALDKRVKEEKSKEESTQQQKQD